MTPSVKVATILGRLRVQDVYGTTSDQSALERNRNSRDSRMKELVNNGVVGYVHRVHHWYAGY